MALNERQQRFVEEYLIDLNATQAAIRAGYSAKTAKQQGQRLLTNVDVSEALAGAKMDRSERTRVDADWLLHRLSLEAEADMADLYDDAGKIKPVREWPLIWRQGLVAGVETVRERGGDDDAISFVDKVKISDRAKRLELIGRHIGVQAFKDRVEHDVSETLAAAIAAGNARLNADPS